ncbi:MAG: CAP domain-containing protein [Sphingobacteriales bacterium]|nr:MAG: CAP domain-containing protein [Sphingobacteriales bacterium]
MRSLISVIILPLLISCASPMPAGRDDKGEQTVSSSKMEAQILDLINNYRARKGLSKLEPNSEMDRVAARHSRSMASKAVPFGHAGFDSRYKELSGKFPGMRSMSENVAYGNLTAQKVVDLWLKSNGHRKNIEGDFNYSGIGIQADNKGQLYFTQLFMKK